jgi:hypothetical protein
VAQQAGAYPGFCSMKRLDTYIVAIVNFAAIQSYSCFEIINKKDRKIKTQEKINVGF